MRLLRRIQLKAMALGRHLVEIGSSLAAQSTCAARPRARPTSVPAALPCSFPPSVRRHQRKGNVAATNRARHNAAIAVAVNSRDLHLSGNDNQAVTLQLGQEVVDVLPNCLLIRVVVRSQIGQ